MPTLAQCIAHTKRRIDALEAKAKASAETKGTK
jgi:hypothetical protein